MEPASLALGVVAIFKDTYLTVKFIQKQVRKIRDYQGEHSEMVMHFDVQIHRFKNFSRLFRAADGNKVDMKLLEGVPTDYLETARRVLEQLQQVLAEYAKLAASLDEDYRRFSPLSLHSAIDLTNDPIEIEIEDNETVGPVEEREDTDGPPETSIPAKRKWWLFRNIGWGSSKPAKPTSRPSSPITLPKSVQWLFTKSKLEQTLSSFKEWNEDLQHLVAPLLVGFGFYDNKELQKRLRSDGEVNIFQGHVDLNNLAVDPSNMSKDVEPSKKETFFVSWSEAKTRMSEPKILAEFKQITRQPGPEGKEGAYPDDLSGSIKKLYGPQLARLLRTAGQHSFRTLLFNSYAWDVEKRQYAFLFDYPPNRSSREPKSLNDFILSSEEEPRYKLELKQRFFVAQTVARAIGAFHSDGWLHKNIRGHAIKFFFLEGGSGSDCDFANPYLTDFEFSRPVGGVTRLAPHAVDLDHEVYRHPDRQGLPTASFSKVHDIYSLGVVLLEIGLWQTAREIHDDTIKYELGGSAPASGLPAHKVKGIFLEDAKNRLAHRMGTAYQEAVVACLDDDWDEFIGSREFANEFQKRVVRKVDLKAFVG